MTNDGSDVSGTPPLTDLVVAATAMHEVFITFVEAGFTRQEALQIVIAQVIQNGMNDGS